MKDTKENAFGDTVPSVASMLKEQEVVICISQMLVSVFRHLGFSEPKSKLIIAKCLKIATHSKSLEEYELSANKLLEKEGVTANIPIKLLERAEKIYSQIHSELPKGTLLDFGCGDGRVGALLAKDGLDVTLTDVYQNKNITATRLPFVLFKQGNKTNFESNSFDNVLSLTVYHHSDDPINSIAETARLVKNGGRVIVIESVFGVDGKELPSKERKKIKRYLSLTSNQQRLVNIFFDHFYNRVIHYSKDTCTKVNVPFNFNTPDNWKKIFAEHGLKEEKVIHLGVDQPAVPEYHTLHVLKKMF